MADKLIVMASGDDGETLESWRRANAEARARLDRLEERIIAMRVELASIEVTSGIPRDNYGTLHANLLALARLADEQARALEQLYGFAR